MKDKYEKVRRRIWMYNRISDVSLAGLFVFIIAWIWLGNDTRMIYTAGTLFLFWILFTMAASGAVPEDVDIK